MSGFEPLAALEDALLSAHAADDRMALVSLYKEAGEIKKQAGETDAACFYFTQAYVFALETGHEAAGDLLGKLVQYGRDAYPANKT